MSYKVGTIKCCGKYCGECIHATVGGEVDGVYITFCHLLGDVETTDNLLDQCPYCVKEGVEV